jgi:stage V sporulation protein SpoVS
MKKGDMMSNRNYRPFNNATGDPSFLVAKGIFEVSSQRELQKILEECRVRIIKDGLSPEDPKILSLQQKANEVERKMEAEQKDAEKNHVKKLGSAIFMSIMNGGLAFVRAIGSRACYNADKAIAIAKLKCVKNGHRILADISFDSGNIGSLQNASHIKEVTAVLFTIRTIEEWTKELGNA